MRPVWVVFEVVSSATKSALDNMQAKVDSATRDSWIQRSSFGMESHVRKSPYGAQRVYLPTHVSMKLGLAVF